jgi:hypothetical protein
MLMIWEPGDDGAATMFEHLMRQTLGVLRFFRRLTAAAIISRDAGGSSSALGLR